MKLHLLYISLFLFLFNIIPQKVQSQTSYQMCNIDTVTNQSGILYDSGGPNGNYQSDEDCSLLISPANNSVIFLTFQSFSSENNWDYFYVYDGPDTSSTLVLLHTGNSIPPPVYCTSGYMLIVWHSDFTIEDSGFACSWNSLACPCDLISGTVFNDYNNNCTIDTGEELNDIPVSLTDSTNLLLLTSTNASGNYSFYVPVGGNYDVSINSGISNHHHFVPSCPSSGTISSASSPTSGNNFGVICRLGTDLSGTITGWNFRPGRVSSVCVNVENNRCYTQQGQIELIFDSNCVPLPDSIGIGYTVSGQTVTLPINNSALSWMFCIQVQVSTSVNIGDSVCIEMNLLPLAGDSNIADNIERFCFPVINSYDPNDKYVSPAGVGPGANIFPDTRLTYTIRFQNTGNASALDIYILDLLDPNLDPTTLDIVASSHTMTWSLDPFNLLRFNFDNINLPDSNANEPASHGYVTYKINPKANAPHLSQIFNRAWIYFDLNSPIVTNTTLNTIDFLLASESPRLATSMIKVFPNPVRDMCRLSFKDRHERTILILDLAGKEIRRFQVSTQDYLLNTNEFRDGFYFILVKGIDGEILLDKFVVSH